MRFSLRQWIVIEVLLLGNALLVVLLAAFFWGNGLANAQFGQPATLVIELIYPATHIGRASVTHPNPYHRRYRTTLARAQPNAYLGGPRAIGHAVYSHRNPGA
jgi:hypothetical protein